MKMYRVVREVEGRTIKEPGITETALRQESIYYAAQSMQQVWDAIDWIRNDPEAKLVAIIEDAPAINVLP